MKKIAEYKMVDGEMQLVTREMTEEEIAALPEVEEEEEETNSENALKEMIIEMSTATTLAQMRNAARAFLEKTE